jgi:hypothetical protein
MKVVTFKVIRAFRLYTHIPLSAMHGNISGNHFIIDLSVLLLHCSVGLKMIQNETISRKFLVSGTWKGHMGPIRRVWWRFQHWYLFSVQKLLCQKCYVGRQIAMMKKPTCLSKILQSLTKWGFQVYVDFLCINFFQPWYSVFWKHSF